MYYEKVWHGLKDINSLSFHIAYLFFLPSLNFFSFPHHFDTLPSSPPLSIIMCRVSTPPTHFPKLSTQSHIILSNLYQTLFRFVCCITATFMCVESLSLHRSLCDVKQIYSYMYVSTSLLACYLFCSLRCFPSELNIICVASSSIIELFQ
jgi:ABC-type transport system involved in cytochrome c biogenesis permease subunit